uniref:Uncharacterized protein n=1 Tax=Anguilla anguilla TaxID=7936 RepID=A0A0E9U178_ANGAN
MKRRLGMKGGCILKVYKPSLTQCFHLPMAGQQVHVNH